MWSGGEHLEHLPLLIEAPVWSGGKHLEHVPKLMRAPVRSSGEHLVEHLPKLLHIVAAGVLNVERYPTAANVELAPVHLIHSLPEPKKTKFSQLIDSPRYISSTVSLNQRQPNLTS